MSNQLGNKDEEGSNNGSRHEGKKVYGETLFLNTRLHNQPLEFKGDIKSQSRPTIPKFAEEHRKEPKLHNESIATWEDRHAEYQTLSEYCRRALPFKDFYESQYKFNSIGSNRILAHNFEFKNSIGKIFLPYFEGSSK